MNKNSKFPILLLSVVFSLISSCGTGENVDISSTPTLYIITATLEPTLTPHPTYSPQPPSPIPTIVPVKGTTTTQVNVRKFPLVSADVMGQLSIFTEIEITGKDTDGRWYRINYSPEIGITPSQTIETGVGWVTTDYIQVDGDAVIPVIPNVVTGQSIPTTLPSTQLSPTPSINIIPTPQPFPSAAIEDGDSPQNPAVDVDFSPTGVRSVSYSSDVSSPRGDLDDWFKFKPYIQPNGPSSVSVIINCAGSNGVNIELQQASQVLQTWKNTTCKTPARLILSLHGNAPFLMRISAGIASAGLNYVNYTITIQQDV